MTIFADIECMAREAGLANFGGCTEENLTRFATLVRVQALEDAARHFDERDAGVGGYYMPKEPAQIIRALPR